MEHTTRKATRHVNQNQGLIFEKSSPGKAAWKLPPLDDPEVDSAKLLGSSERTDPRNMPEVSEIDTIRHFTRLSTWNYAIDLGMNRGIVHHEIQPRVNEVVARLDGLANAHPSAAGQVSQGALRIMQTLSECLIEMTGMDAIMLQPGGGRALRDDRLAAGAGSRSSEKESAQEDLDSWSPPTEPILRRRRWVGYAWKILKSNALGMVDPAALAAQMNEDVAALMLTNPNTLGFSSRRFIRSRESCTPRAACSTWTAPT